MNYIVIISLVANVILAFQLFRIKRKVKLLNGTQPIIDGPLASGKDLFNDITKSKELFRILKKEIHPDKFIDNEELRLYAEKQMMELGKIQHSYTSMLDFIEEMKKEKFPFSEHIRNMSNN